MGVEGQTDDFSMVFFNGIFQWYFSMVFFNGTFQWYFSGVKKPAFEGQKNSHRKFT
jgi:hypothetical protein